MAGALREILAKFGFEVDDRELKKGEKRADGFADKVKGALAVWGASEIIGGIRSFVTEMVDLEGHITDTSAQLGIATKDFQAWSYAAQRSGASADDVTAGLRVLQRNAVDAGAKFKDLGVDVKDGTGQMKPTTQLFREVGLAIAGLPTPAERTAKAMELLGKGGTKLGPIFANGAEGVDALMARFEELGGGIGEDALAVLGEAGDAMDDLELATTSLKGGLAVALAPALTWVMGKVGEAAVFFRKLSTETNVLKAALVVLGVVGARAGWMMLRPYLPFIAGVAAAVLILDELITTFQGGDTLIRRFVDGIFGVGATKGVVDALKDNFGSLWRELEKAPGVGAKIEAAFSLIGADIVKFFAEDIGAAIDLWVSRNPEIADATLAMTNDVVAAIESVNLLKRLVDWFVGVKERFAAEGAEWKAWAHQAAGDVIAGLVGGLTGGLVQIDDAVSTVGTRLKKGIRGPKGIDARSPSKPAQKAGHDFIDGLLLPATARLGEIEAVSARAAHALIPTSVVGANMSRNVNVGPTTNHVSVNAPGPSAREIAWSTRSAVAGVMSDERRALAAAVMG